MKRSLAVLLTAAIVLAAAGTGVAAWFLTHHDGGPAHPQISAYSHGEMSRVGPYFFCNVLNLNDCDTPQEQGALRVDDRDPVQLSVPSQIGAAPWRLLMVYDDPVDTTSAVFRPNTRLAVTIPTVDPQRGPLRGFTVQLLTLVQDANGELFEAPHAEWSVRTNWDQPKPDGKPRSE
jgi:Protein of unknown function (DUF2771)